MAKRALSSTLKNLKFMQKAAQKQEKSKEEEEETKPDANYFPYVVIMEGDPHPGTTKGRMSFQNFNCSVDKLNDEAAIGHEGEASTPTGFQSGRNSDRVNCPLEQTGMDMWKAEGELKRKMPEEVSQTSQPNTQQKRSSGNKQPSSSENHSSQKQAKRDKLDFNLLVRSNSQSKSQGPRELASPY